jgi:hypothetical protein
VIDPPLPIMTAGLKCVARCLHPWRIGRDLNAWRQKANAMTMNETRR